jgi:asparagine N-glycosylation enzyme membrane subunit Stt3
MYDFLALSVTGFQARALFKPTFLGFLTGIPSYFGGDRLYLTLDIFPHLHDEDIVGF